MRLNIKPPGLITTAKWALAVFFLLGVGLGIYCWHLSIEIDTRFSGRRWRIPSKVYSDVTFLYPGQTLNRPLFLTKLRRMGYAQVPYTPTRKGEFHLAGSEMQLYLHDLSCPAWNRPGFPIVVRFMENHIESLKRPVDQDALPFITLEPEEIMLFFGPDRERRRLISISRLPRHVIHAVLAAEDARFYYHHGIDTLALLRALYTNVRSGTIRQGGSTITQQLAKNYFLTPERSLRRKLKEALIAITMEFLYSKDEILEIYLNEIYLGQKGPDAINGIGEAAMFYFGKPAEELTLSEAAVIAGLIRGPNHYSPYINIERCRKRRNQVLVQMASHGWIDTAVERSAEEAPIQTVGFDAYSRKAPYFGDFLTTQLRDLYSSEALTTLGMSIYTTLDTQVQMAAEDALEKGLARLEQSNPKIRRKDPAKALQGAILVMHPKTGYILAMVGGRNYGISQFNRITQAKRQPGSAFKPFIYAASLDAFTPASLLSNEPKTYDIDGKPWEPRNYEPMPEKTMRLREALARSANIPTVDLAVRTGLEQIINTATAFGFTTPMKPYPSLALGAFEVIPLELARAYCPFAADGLLPYPLALKDVLDDQKAPLERRHMHVRRVISAEKAYLMTSMLRSVVEEGTAKSLKSYGIDYPVAAKTGTTDQERDAWFVGYTPDILAMIWVGFDDGESIHATGARAALPIWAALMKAIPQYRSEERFRMPEDMEKRTICAETGELAVPNRCPHPMEEIFLPDNVPESACRLHGSHILEELLDNVGNLFKRKDKN